MWTFALAALRGLAALACCRICGSTPQARPGFMLSVRIELHINGG